MPVLKNWSAQRIPDNFYQAPETCRTRIYGEVYGHPCFNDGDAIKTSFVLSLNLNTNVVKTQNTTYCLGPVDRKWLKEIRKNGYKLEDYQMEL